MESWSRSDPSRKTTRTGTANPEILDFQRHTQSGFSALWSSSPHLKDTLVRSKNTCIRYESRPNAIFSCEYLQESGWYFGKSRKYVVVFSHKHPLMRPQNIKQKYERYEKAIISTTCDCDWRDHNAYNPEKAAETHTRP